MRAQIALRKVATTSGDFTNLRNAAGRHTNAGTHSVAIALGSHQFEIQEMVSVATAVVQDQWRISVVPHHHIQEAAVVEVREGDAPANVGGLKAAARDFRGLHKLAVALIMKQRVDLLEA